MTEDDNYSARKREITLTASGACSVFAADVDGDGDVDLLSASFMDDTIAWYQNLGGSPTAFETRVITAAANSARSVFAIDVDGDGNVDVLSANFNDATLAWYENDEECPPSGI